MSEITSISDITTGYRLFDPIEEGLVVDPTALFYRIVATAVPYLNYIEPAKMVYDTGKGALKVYSKVILALSSASTDGIYINTYEAFVHTVGTVSLVFAWKIGLAFAILFRITKDSKILLQLTREHNFEKVPKKLMLIAFSIFSLALLFFPSIPLLASTIAYKVSCSAFISYHRVFDGEIPNKITSIALYYIIASLSLPILLVQRITFPKLKI